MNTLKHFLINGLFAAVFTVASLSVQASEKPAEFVENTVNELLAEFTERRSYLEGNKKDLFELVDRLAGPAFDFGYISKLVLGKNWKSATENQRSEFAHEFKRLLIVTYATALFRYTGNESMEIGDTEIKEKKGKRFSTVNTEVSISDGEPVPVVYSLIDDGTAGWKVYNLTVGTLNMVINYRNVIQSSIHSKGLDGLIAEMKESNDTNYN